MHTWSGWQVCPMSQSQTWPPQAVSGQSMALVHADAVRDDSNAPDATNAIMIHLRM